MKLVLYDRSEKVYDLGLYPCSFVFFFLSMQVNFVDNFTCFSLLSPGKDRNVEIIEEKSLHPALYNLFIYEQSGLFLTCCLKFKSWDACFG